MLSDILKHLQLGTIKPQKQDNKSKILPRRFPDDGIIFWDELSTRQIHNRIRALTKPYPCVRSFSRREVLLFSSKLPEIPCWANQVEYMLRRKATCWSTLPTKSSGLPRLFRRRLNFLYDSINVYDSLQRFEKLLSDIFDPA